MLHFPALNVYISASFRIYFQSTQKRAPKAATKREGKWRRHEKGSTALDFYRELKVVCMDYTGRKCKGNFY